MMKRDDLLLFFLGVAVAAAAALFQPVPGYMDAEYYYGGGTRLYEGAGFTEMILWNYLDEPAGLPHPSHTYWMPLPSIVAAAGMGLAGSDSFLAARIVFILLWGIVPVLTTRLAQRFGADRLEQLFAGALALFPGFYLLYVSNTEGFTLYMLLGTVFILASFSERLKEKWTWALLLGGISGLLHLTRADGVLWLGFAVVIIAFQFFVSDGNRTVGRLLLWLAAALMGYFLVMSPWYVRNVRLYGQLTAPGGAHTLWLTDYDQTFAFPAERLSMSSWLASGWADIVMVRLNALWMNVKTALAVQFEVFLLPLAAAGIWKLRRVKTIRFGALMWAATLLVMSLVFPFAGARGGFLHSGAAFQPLIWAASAGGFSTWVDWGNRKRNWNRRQAFGFLGVGIVFISAVMASGLFYVRVVGTSAGGMAWRQTWDHYVEVEQRLQALGVEEGDLVVVNNPPGYYAAARRAAIVIPDGGTETLRQVSERYQAVFVLLEKNHVEGLKGLYENPRDLDWLDYLETCNGTHIFLVDDGT